VKRQRRQDFDDDIEELNALDFDHFDVDDEEDYSSIARSAGSWSTNVGWETCSFTHARSTFRAAPRRSSALRERSHGRGVRPTGPSA